MVGREGGKEGKWEIGREGKWQGGREGVLMRVSV